MCKTHTDYSHPRSKRFLRERPEVLLMREQAEWDWGRLEGGAVSRSPLSLLGSRLGLPLHLLFH